MTKPVKLGLLFVVLCVASWLTAFTATVVEPNTVMFGWYAFVSWFTGLGALAVAIFWIAAVFGE